MTHQWTSSSCPVCAEMHCNKAECRSRLIDKREELIVIDLDSE